MPVTYLVTGLLVDNYLEPAVGGHVVCLCAASGAPYGEGFAQLSGGGRGNGRIPHIAVSFQTETDTV